ncbi:YebC/PmpR family DNA-binding transcriptional regulator [Paenibacillus allorhizosphaerae]|uniref:Probable transcriptional regulatory protein PAECIP111802_04780 n=1 Tax=Paenibacillus allorhizosphaerae TaxID=2849866 RepID=A0ABM8VMY4_9BACL|nr:YebC/PmpR family DNA-binding transcriptional regulator [Paenibacillus allorhizosphaerae]CAG7650677.1 putative transcriptional regulatory protein [Paenibacillus allorhizosphaerae]
MKFKLFKERKGKADQAKNNQFVKIGREIFMAARQGGPNPEANFALKVAMENARRLNMPKDNVERAIKKATGDGDNIEYEEIMYEGYGPGGIAIMVKCLTDNRNRSAADVRAVFNKRGGNMGESGCVYYMFDQKGILRIDREEHVLDEDELMMQALEAGAEDVAAEEGSFEIVTHPHDFEQVKTALESQGLQFTEAAVTWVPQNTIKVEGENAEKLMKMMDAFDDLDDVQDVYSNYEVDEEELAKIG